MITNGVCVKVGREEIAVSVSGKLPHLPSDSRKTQQSQTAAAATSATSTAAAADDDDENN
jgi:hypothetical protein